MEKAMVLDMEEATHLMRDCVQGPLVIDRLKSEINSVIGFLICGIRDRRFEREKDFSLEIKVPGTSVRWTITCECVPHSGLGHIHELRYTLYLGSEEIYFRRDQEQRFLDLRHITSVHAAIPLLIYGLLKKVPELRQTLEPLSIAAAYTG